MGSAVYKRYYIAYGSNLSVERMKQRAPDARIVGTAVLKGWQLLFRQYATIRKKAGYTTPVLVWDISEQDEKNLDRYEGAPRCYFKEMLPVVVTPLNGGKPAPLIAMAYIMTDCPRKSRLPRKWYYDILESGYAMFGFNKAILVRAIWDSVDMEMAAGSRMWRLVARA